MYEQNGYDEKSIEILIHCYLLFQPTPQALHSKKKFRSIMSTTFTQSRKDAKSYFLGAFTSLRERDQV
ncbi:MAG: hypothetical protein KGJ59_12710 [Bacteroidota bacterium]|nr:hypothetical protein [Bacteroidota bacterium]